MAANGVQTRLKSAGLRASAALETFNVFSGSRDAGVRPGARPSAGVRPGAGPDAGAARWQLSSRRRTSRGRVLGDIVARRPLAGGRERETRTFSCVLRVWGLSRPHSTPRRKPAPAGRERHPDAGAVRARVPHLTRAQLPSIDSPPHANAHHEAGSEVTSSLCTGSVSRHLAQA